MLSSSQAIAIVLTIAIPSVALQIGMRAENHLIQSGSKPIKMEYDSGKCLDWNLKAVDLSTKENSTIMYPCNGQTNQKWFFDGEQIKSDLNTSMCLDYDLEAVGHQIIMWPCHGDDNQKWYFEYGAIKSKYDSSKCLDFNQTDGFDVVLSDCHHGTDQNWYFDGPCTDCSGRVAASVEIATLNKNGQSQEGMSFCFRQNEELDSDATACEKYWAQLVGSNEPNESFPCVYVASTHRCQTGERFGEQKCC